MKKRFRVLACALAIALLCPIFGTAATFADTAPGTDTASSQADTPPYSDTYGNLSLPLGTGYTFKITGTAEVSVGTGGVVGFTFVGSSGNDSYYKIVASGPVGSSTGLYMAAPGQAAQRFCVVTVAPQLPSPSTVISYSDSYQHLKYQPLKKNEMMYAEISVNDPDFSLSISSSNENVVEVSELQKEDNKPGSYIVGLFAAEEGSATLTITASDNTVDKTTVVVQGTLDKDYTLTSDTTQDFTIPQSGSYFLKLNYKYTGPTDDPSTQSPVIGVSGADMTQIPMLVSDNPAVQVTPVSGDPSTGVFLFRIDAAGAVGQSATLYTGSYNYIPELLCKATILGAPKDLRLDTAGVYRCNTGDTYTFVAYTNSAAPPAASASNSLASVQYVQKVTGGYEYRMTVPKLKKDDPLFTGSSLVRVTQGNETVSFPVDIDNTFYPTVVSDTSTVVKLAKGQSYTYKFTIMGGGGPTFTGIYMGVGTTPNDPGIMSVQLVKKDGPDYYVKVTALSDKIGEQSDVCIRFPNSRWYSPNTFSGYGTVEITPDPSKPVVPMKSDTTSDFTLAQNRSYTFKLTGAPVFTPEYEGTFHTELIGKSGDDYYYRITPQGLVGQRATFSMYNGITTQKVCTVTIGDPIPVAMKSDTTQNFSLAQGQSYTFKISGATAFNPGTDGVFQTELVKRSGGDSYFKITAIGPAGSSSGMYMGVADQPVQKVCTVSITAPGAFISDTNSDFTIPNGKTYTFKITAPGAKTVNLTAGTADTFQVISSRRSGNDFYFTIGNSSSTRITGGKVSGVYVSADGQTPKKICVVTLAGYASAM